LYASLLQSYRDQAISEQEKQAAFEKFVIAYLTQDPLQKQEYEKVQTYREVADEKGWKGSDIDTDIDLVAKIRDQDDYVAIRCQFY
uniref:restriction endonuclease n=1 Tax=Bartonella queenslandensis TaxID=481138 RepID=UPI000584A17D